MASEQEGGSGFLYAAVCIGESGAAAPPPTAILPRRQPLRVQLRNGVLVVLPGHPEAERGRGRGDQPARGADKRRAAVAPGLHFVPGVHDRTAVHVPAVRSDRAEEDAAAVRHAGDRLLPDPGAREGHQRVLRGQVCRQFLENLYVSEEG